MSSEPDCHNLHQISCARLYKVATAGSADLDKGRVGRVMGLSPEHPAAPPKQLYAILSVCTWLWGGASEYIRQGRPRRGVPILRSIGESSCMLDVDLVWLLGCHPALTHNPSPVLLYK